MEAFFRFWKFCPTLQITLTSAGKSSEVIRFAIGWTPRFTTKTRMHPKTTLLQSMITVCSSKCQCSRWVARSKVVPKTARLQAVAMAEAEARCLLLNLTSRLVREREAMRRTAPTRIAE